LNHTATSGFRKLCFTTLVAVYFLIFVGGLVRSTGSGMGCPDWPKCFGSFIPPTSIDQLPKNYKEIYSEYRDKKNQRFAAFLNKIGQEETARAILNDDLIKKEADFDAVKTMIEYVNRLIGAIIGLLLTALFLLSFRQPWVYRILIGLSWFFVLVTGWFGSIVVSTNLTSWTVSIHLALAFIIIGLLSAAWSLTNIQTGSLRIVPGYLVGLAIFLLVGQIFLGTSVRSEIDLLASTLLDRAEWVSNLGNSFLIHRTFSWLILLSFGAISWLLIKRSEKSISAVALLAVVLGLMCSGAILNYLGMPWIVQPFHLLLATIAFGTLINVGISISTVAVSSSCNP